MESAESSINTSPKRGASCRKLRSRNYLNHLVNLWLFCGNVSVDGRNCDGNASAVENLLNSTSSSSILTATFYNASFTPSTASNWDGHKSFNKAPEISDFNRTASNSMSFEEDIVACSDSSINASNKSSLSEKLFHSIKSKAERKDWLKNSINHNEIPAHLGGAITQNDANQLENIVNIARITNEAAASVRRVRKSKNPVRTFESGLSMNYNQSSSRGPQPPRNQSARKKVKSDRKAAANATAKIVPATQKLSKVSLLGLFEMTTHLGTRWEGKSELAAAELAVKHINERGLLPGYTLELITNDTQVSSAWVYVRAR